MTETMELLPCPFCGAAAYLIKPPRNPENESELLWPALVQCWDCDASQMSQDEDEAVAAWNRRAHPTPVQREPSEGEVEALIAREWQSLLDADDRTSPEEYPDMALITQAEFAAALRAAYALREQAEPVAAVQECATEGCGNPGTERFEVGGVGSYYCPDCMAKINARFGFKTAVDPADPRSVQAGVRAAYTSPTSDTVREGVIAAAAAAGWNACRKSLYAVCEDVQSEADRLRISAPVGSAAEEQHSKGYHAGSKFAAKSIARGFNAMEARDDDNFRAALEQLRRQP